MMFLTKFLMLAAFILGGCHVQGNPTEPGGTEDEIVEMEDAKGVTPEDAEDASVGLVVLEEAEEAVLEKETVEPEPVMVGMAENETPTQTKGVVRITLPEDMLDTKLYTEVVEKYFNKLYPGTVLKITKGEKPAVTITGLPDADEMEEVTLAEIWEWYQDPNEYPL